MSHFYRSTNIVKDLDDQRLLDHLIVTQPMLKSIHSVKRVFSAETADAAIAIVGPYGSGKSTSAVAAINYLRGTLPPRIGSEMIKSGIDPLSEPIQNGNIFTLIGERASLNAALKRVLASRFDTSSGIALGISQAIQAKPESKYVLVIDEIGKYLEYAVDHPAKGDLYILQQLAELASRSKGHFILITIRHQALQAYITRLHRNQLQEWEKIQGRFHEIVHTTTLEETLHLFAEALHDQWPSTIQLGQSLEGFLKKSLDLNELTIEKCLFQSYPLHPLTMLLLVSIFKRLAQNERSIFSFLATTERASLKHFQSTSSNDRSYEIANLFDYLDQNLYHTILESDVANGWMMIHHSLGILKSKGNNSALESRWDTVVRLIKSIGLLDLFGQEVGLKPTKDTIVNSVYGTFNGKTSSCPPGLIHEIEAASVLTYRRLFKTYHLWQGSDINVDELLRNESERLRLGFDYALFFQRHLPQMPIAARKLYIEKGTFRYAGWQFISENEPIVKHRIESDGIILCIILDKASLKSIKERYDQSDLDANVLVTGIRLKAAGKDLILRLATIHNLLTHYQPLARDKVAREELLKQELYYRKAVDDLFSRQKATDSTLYLFSKGSGWDRVNWDDIGMRLSERLDQHYSATPTIHNELINTNVPSPSAIVGLKQVLYGLVEKPHEKNLGIQGTGPEYSIYLNILAETGIHRLEGNGWGLFDPDTRDYGLKKTWKHITKKVKDTVRTRSGISLSEIENALLAYPFGLKTGLIKVLVLANILRHWANISLYEDGTFVPVLFRDTIDRMLKLPHKFAVRFVQTSGLHQVLFKKLYEIVKEERKDYVTLLEVIKPLVQFVNHLPDYTKQTKSISQSSRACLEVLLTTTQPEKAIYESLPVALGLPPFTDDQSFGHLPLYISSIERVHSELRNARDRLFDECVLQFRKHWEAPEGDLAALRTFVRMRFAEEVASLITDEKLRAFSKRVRDDAVPDDQWLESIAALLTNKPLDKWTDHDLQMYIAELQLRLHQLRELERFAATWKGRRSAAGKKVQKIEKQINDLLDELDATEEEKLTALSVVHERRFKGRRHER